MKNIFFVILLSLIPAAGISQIVHQVSSPVGYYDDPAVIEWYDLYVNGSETESIIEGAKGKNGPFIFAIPRFVELNPANSGMVVKQDDKKSIWYLFVRSGDAKSLNIIFSKFRLKESESLFIYDPGMDNTLGPFTKKNNKISGTLPVAPLKGSELIIEYHFNPADGGEVQVGQISHDVLGVFGSSNSKDGYYNSSGNCNVDINCPEAEDWQTDKRSVIRIIAGGVQLGSAVLLNNSNQQNIPYLLTAKHVVRNESYANNLVAVFNYESAWCDGPDGSVIYSIAGSELVAQNSDIDMALVKLSEFPPILYKPYLAGWNVSSTLPSRSVIIHHPSGDVKKISFDDDAPIITSFMEFIENGFWKILQWDAGTTEGGSSGAPLFNQNHQVVGYLSGGEAVCGRSVNDYFARLDIAYDLSARMDQSLKPWLDPAQSGTSYLNGRDPYQDKFQNSDTLFNGNEDEIFLTDYSSSGTGFTTGFNSDSLTAYAEKFYLPSTKEITDIFLYIGTSNFVDSYDSVTVSVLSDDNGPGPVIASTSVKINASKSNFNLRLDFSEPVVVSGTFYIAYKLWYKESADSEPRQFALYHSAGQLPGSDFSWFKDASGWHPFSEHPFDPGDISLYIKVIAVQNSIVDNIEDENFKEDILTIFPNPFSDILEIKDNRHNTIEGIEIYDIMGRVVKSYPDIRSSSAVLNNLQDLERGIYIIGIRGEYGYIFRKSVKK